ncbi:RsmD family RNA methyltransferase [Evansella sp. AB-P1]|uniref:TRM11 family SAM-dependent methyltransferase n=1 Tax=Evansella sp. AB-P1 TaxID=3037653 RepID=UPI00241DA425|nr:RsmD family RNA methyltransferase [Evansella sp. AB-P1]MDG5787185.1 RsmD family RNA methyltransferase [Evansella sp. AB-P1]
MTKNYIYIYSYTDEEKPLCLLEMRSFFGNHSEKQVLESAISIHPNRSPFIKERLDILYEDYHYDDLLKKIQGFPLDVRTFKVVFVKNPDLSRNEKVSFHDRRNIEREIGLKIDGNPDLKNPVVLFGIMYVNGRWVFGEYMESEAIWHQHQWKPNSYSTALSTRVARTVANIAAPNPVGKKVIDPCCGIGTVLIEALSMGINICGSDNNPLVLDKTRENIKYFGFKCEVKLKDIREVRGRYDSTIIDMPYNICSVITENEKLEMLKSARNFSMKLVLISVEYMDEIIDKAGFTIEDRCIVKKGKFSRQIIVCS